MFDVWIGDVELTTLVIIVAIVAVLPIQLLLCFKIKNLLLRLLPSILFTIVIISFFAMIFSSQDWDSIGYAILAMLALVPIVRILILNSHSYQHSFFTYRALFGSICCIITAVCKVIDPKLLMKKK